ncbi:Domain of uncharacterised function (DUF3578) [Aeromonas salmonicida]|uniref:MrcB family domain-containing protein n=1 Tax=Aeromonas salmonicida TaxID=645 RepID=UPI0010276CCD|nr:DUF3578 domain-containing protein [Aeromonas salmonicida]VFB11118.1 Domain of uncharacterised function (DUF3578) [Aeromonas salmonicida]
MSKIQSLFKKILSNWVRAVTEQFTNHPTAVIFRTELKESIENIAHRSNKEFKIKASVGAGNWANVPWISILDTRITTTTQSGIYPVYLFCADGSGFYLSLNQGTTAPTREFGAIQAQRQAIELKSQLLNNISELSTWDNDPLNLHATTNLGRSYEPTNISAKYYPADDIPSDEELIKDLEWLLGLYDKCVSFLSNEEHPRLDIKNLPQFNPASLYKQFLLLAGISGTGKTRFIREQVKDYPGQKNYSLVPVRPDWHEPSDLLGYISRISGKKEYVSTPVLHFITQAWIHIFECVGEVRSDGKIGLSQKQLDHIPPFWLCLDEMNLAPVEQYFADYLSVLETRHWYTSPERATFNDKEGIEYDYLYQCDPLLKADTLSQQLDDNACIELAEKLGLDLDISLHQEIWASFCQHGIAIPFNLMVAGTVNMDETTHGFSRKVIDRALTFDFNEFFPNDFDAYFTPALQPKLLGYPTWSDGRAITEVPALEQYSKESVTFLKAVNEVLQQSPFELAYRALNELMLALLAHHPEDNAELVAIWDDFMMCKVLPRIEGDSDKLRSHQTADGDLLTDLEKVLAEQFTEHWEGTRPDLFNRKVATAGEGSTPAEPPHVPCRSKKKLAWMKERLARQCFTSFWP